MASAVNARLQRAGAPQTARGERVSRKLQPPPNVGVVLLWSVLVGVALAHVWLRLPVFQMGYELSTASKLQNQLEQEQRELKVELATLMSPDRLEAMARKRLGLASPEKGQVIVLP